MEKKCGGRHNVNLSKDHSILSYSTGTNYEIWLVDQLLAACRLESILDKLTFKSFLFFYFYSSDTTPHLMDILDMFNDSDDMALDQFDIDLNFSIDNYTPEPNVVNNGLKSEVGE